MRNSENFAKLWNKNRSHALCLMEEIHMHEIIQRLDRIEAKIDLLYGQTRSIIHLEKHIMSQLTDALDQAEAAATANSQADDAAEALLVSISQMLKDAVANGTPAEQIARVSALASGLSARAAQLGTAVAANTPAAPAP
jgi:hypothetical protein